MEEFLKERKCPWSHVFFNVDVNNLFYNIEHFHKWRPFFMKIRPTALILKQISSEARKAY